MADMDTIGSVYGEATICSLCWSDPSCGHPESGTADNISEATYLALRMDSTRKSHACNLANYPDEQYDGVDPLAEYLINRDRALDHFDEFRRN